MEIIIKQDGQAASRAAARVVARLVREKPDAVLGLATGSTPLMLYMELIRLHREDGLDFSRVITFNLDEYIGLEKNHPQSYHTFMRENLFSHINIASENVHIPDGMAADVPASCASYELEIVKAGGIDLQVLGIGSDGHIGFNEPTSSFASRTRIKTLTQQTVKDNARFFDGDESKVPHHCITMGIGTIMDARMNIMLAFGEGKAAALAATVEGAVSSMVPASILQHHPSAKVFIDEAAASALKLSDYYRWVYDGKPEWQRDA
jgi:glucosamine-6-phosphate deaminase